MVDVTEDIGHFVGTLPWQEIFVASVYLLAGAMAHWVKEASQGKVPWNLWQYCFKQYPARSVLLSCALMSAGWVLVTAQGSYTWPTFIAQAFTAGYVANSLANKGDAPYADPVADEQRTSAQPPKEG